MKQLNERHDLKKYAFFIFNLVVMITGIILIKFGNDVADAYSEYDLFLAQKFFTLPIFLMVIGSFVIIISFFGWWGAFKEDYRLILYFSVLLSIIFVLEVVAGIGGYTVSADTEGSLNRTLHYTMMDYKKDYSKPISVLWDFLQREFGCCGVEDYKDWYWIVNDKTALPLSCCQIPYAVIGSFNCTSSEMDPNRFFGGCLSRFSKYIAVNADSLVEAVVVIAALHFLGIIFTCYIACKIKILNISNDTGKFYNFDQNSEIMQSKSLMNTSEKAYVIEGVVVRF